MILTTDNHAWLYNQDSGKNIEVKPGVEFEPFKSDDKYKVGSFVRVYDKETGVIVEELNPGTVIQGIGPIPKKRTRKPKEE